MNPTFPLCGKRHIRRMTTIRTVAMIALTLFVLLGAVALSVQASEGSPARSGATAMALIGDSTGDDGRPPRPGPTDPNTPTL